MDFDLLNALSYLERSDGVIAIPVDTAYMLACRVNHPEALARTTRIRGQKSPEPMLLLGHDANALRPYATPFPSKAENLIAQHWPGPLMIVLPKSEALPDGISAGADSIGLMQPNSPLLLDLLALQPDGVLAAIMAKRYDETIFHTAAAVYNAFGDDVDFLLPGDQTLTAGPAATMVRIEGNGGIRLLRTGAIVLD